MKKFILQYKAKRTREEFGIWADHDYKVIFFSKEAVEKALTQDHSTSDWYPSEYFEAEDNKILLQIGVNCHSNYDTKGLVHLGRHDVSWRNTTDTDFYCHPDDLVKAKEELTKICLEAKSNQDHYYSKQYV